MVTHNSAQAAAQDSNRYLDHLIPCSGSGQVVACPSRVLGWAVITSGALDAPHWMLPTSARDTLHQAAAAHTIFHLKVGELWL